MGRRVDTGWYDTYLLGKALEEAGRETSPSDPEIAAQLSLKPKTWSRIKIAGRLLDGLTPSINREQIRCGYAPLERLARLWSTSPEIAPELLNSVLRNELKLPDLEIVIRANSQSPSKNDAPQPVRASVRKNALFSQLERFFESSRLHPFDAYKGRVLRRRSTLGAPSGYYVYNARGEVMCLVLCIRAGAWRDPATTARELYEHALSQRDSAPVIWLVFERDNAVLQYLAELSLHWGGSPYDPDGHWLFLAHFIDSGYLQVLFEDDFARLIQRIRSGDGLVEESDLFCQLEAIDGLSAPEREPLRPLRALPDPSRTRSFREVVHARIQAVGMADSASAEERRARLEIDFDL